MKICRFSSDTVKKEKIMSGIAPNFYYMSKELNKFGVEEHILCQGFSNDKIGDNTYTHGIPTTARFGLHYGKLYIIPFGFFGLLKFRKLHERHNFDIIHGHNYDPYMITKLKGFTKNVPIVVTFHAILKGFQRIKDDLTFANWGQKTSFNLLDIAIRMEKSICKNSDAIVAISENEKRELITEYHTKPNKIKVIYNGVDSEHFRPMENNNNIRTRYGIGKIPLVTYVGGIGVRKGLPYMMESIPYVLKEIPETMFMFVGGSDKPFVDKLIHRAKELGIEKNIVFTGSINHFDLPKYYNTGDIYAMSPLYDDIPKALMEAMACGKAVVSTNVDGIPEIVNKDSGILVPPRSPQAFANAIIKLLSDKELSMRMGENGRKQMVKNYTWQQTAEQYMRLYETLG